jgi:glycosyltransferase involved in cell wall biosynthesis
MGANLLSSASISVGVPAYNQGEYIRATLLGLLNQGEPPHELVVCNNHSNDSTAEVLDGFAGELTVISPPHHLPMMENWNHLIESMTGEWIALVSSDDTVLPGFVEALKRGIVGNPDAVLIHGNVARIGTDGSRLRIRADRSLDPEPPPINLNRRLRGPGLNWGAVAFRRDAWQKIGGFRNECPLAGDWEFWLELCALGDFVAIPEVIAEYRIGVRSPEAEFVRIPIWARDFQRLYHEVIPRISKKIGGPGKATIEHAMRTKCHNFLSHSCLHLDPDQCRQLASELQDWAEKCGVPSAWAELNAGRCPGRLRWRAVREVLARISDPFIRQ